MNLDILKQGEWYFHDLRVYYEDTDFSGVVYHSNYLKFAERGRTECLRSLDVHHSELAKLDPALAFVIADMSMVFHSPARIDEHIRVATRFTKIGAARLMAQQLILQMTEPKAPTVSDLNVDKDYRLLWSCELSAACVDFSGKPRRMPKDLIGDLQQHAAAQNVV